MPLKGALENYTFLPFSVFLAIFWIFTYKKVPETKNKTFEEILALFRHGNGSTELAATRKDSMSTAITAAGENSSPENVRHQTTD
ncbi:glucose transporter type 1-like [Ctenocephalides felis]|uniref:glucose transporter type 1-like n=1 Tax=Ctenocephalides felis TaxID=7515 RepID=UPI000E6E4904|nr:glucose transporter type 1-like [Ctenocephalides felis]